MLMNKNSKKINKKIPNYNHLKLDILKVFFLVVLFLISISIFFQTRTFSSLLSAGDYAKFSLWDGTSVATSFDGGTGTQNDPYEIATGAQLMYFKSLIEGASYATYNSAYYKLTNNINLNDNTIASIGTPVSVTTHSSNLRIFKGSFDGNGYIIANGAITAKASASNDYYMGLFAMTDNATIQNLNLVEITMNRANITTYNNLYVGTITAAGLSSSSSIIKNCGVYDTVITTTNIAKIGDIIGYQDMNTMIDGVYANASITTNTSSQSGNIVGYSISTVNDNIKNSVIYNNTITALYGYTADANKYSNVYRYTYLNSIFTVQEYIYSGSLNLVNSSKTAYDLASVLTSRTSEQYNWVVYNDYLKFDNDTTISSADILSNFNASTFAPGMTFNNTGISGSVIYLNDMQSDYYHYMGLNFTGSSDGYLPSGENQHIYSESTLVPMKIYYYGVNTGGNLQGYVSTSEQQDTYVYYKAMFINNNGTSVTTDDYVMLELMDNPFTDRPNNMAFNGWVTDYADVVLTHDSATYTRYMKVPVTYTGSKPDNIEIDIHASWAPAVVYTKTTANWTTSFASLAAAGMRTISAYTTYPTLSDSFQGGPAGFFRSVTINRNASQVGYYNNLGVLQTSGTCASTTCVVYELIQYYDINGTPEVANQTTSYFYLVTRDINIIVLAQTVANTWASGQNKPFTLTSIYNDTDYTSAVVWTVSGVAVRSYADTVLENIKINSAQALATGASNPPSGSTSRNFYGGWFNTKLGRGIIQSSTIYTNFTSAMGGYASSIGSSTVVKKYKFIVESGVYNALSVAAGTVGTSYTDYIEAVSIYGSDFDRASSTNNLLTITYCASGSWGGIYYASSTIEKSFDLTVKSGRYGTNEYDYTTGIYVGGRYGGTHNSARQITVEGGQIYNLIGGPLTNSTRSSYNDTYMYIKGGTIDVIIGGAGSTATYGNRIIQVTGGLINYSVFGGSNGYEGANGDGTVNGSSLLFIGGDATIGNSSLVAASSTIWGAEAGSVFGIGNGNSSYSSIGSNDNSEIIIANTATVNRNVYGGGNFSTTGVSSAYATTKTDIKVLGGTIQGSVYGGGNNNGSGSATKASTINVSMINGTVNGSIYGGSNAAGTVYGDVNVGVTSGTIAGSVYGGGRGGYASASVLGTYVSGNVSVSIGNRSYGTAPSIAGTVYGGSAYGTVNNTVRNATKTAKLVTVNYYTGTVSSVYGGAQGSGTFTPYVAGDINVNMYGGTVTSLYGGNNAAGVPNGSTNLNLNGGTATTVFGGGNAAATLTNNVNLNGGTTTTIYGGGNSAGSTTTNVYLISGTVTSVYGGSNQTGVVASSNIYTTSETGNITIPTIYGGNNAGGTTTNSNINLDGITVTNLYGGGNAANVTGSTTLDLTSVTITGTLYGGGNNGAVLGNTNLTTLTSTFQGEVFGGGNQGDVNGNTTLDMTNSDFSMSLYGGGNNGDILGSTNLTLTTSDFLMNVYGGGNQGFVDDNASLLVDDSNVLGTVFGGGNEGDINTNTNVIINNSDITQSVYSGGNSAIVAGNTNILVAGTTTVIGSVFGGGNSGAVGSTAQNNSIATVNIIGGDISTNVYGGCNTSVVYGQTIVNIGSSAVTNGYNRGVIDVAGTVFGGGEANASGSETYDFSFISVTNGINIDINGDDYNSDTLVLEGSVFGSGNASSSSGTSIIKIKDLGTMADPNSCISIQRANEVEIDNSTIEFVGTTDRTNEYSSLKYSINRIDLLKIKNNTSLLLQQNANLLKELQSLVDVGETEELASVSIDANYDVTRNTNNRIYLLANKNLNVTTNESATAYGRVSGMSFLGMYTSYVNGEYSYGIYDLESNDEADAGDVIIGGSYVLGLHPANYNIEENGFYSNYITEDFSKVESKYIVPTPESANYYIWAIGLDSISYSFTLTASKYSSLGTYQLSLIDFPDGNTTFEVLGFNALGLDSGVTLVDSALVPKIGVGAETNTIFGLSMKAETAEWTSSNATKFLSANDGSYTGDDTYLMGNQSSAPTLNFYLYHAKNIELDDELGSVTVVLQALTPINEIEYEISLITINIDITARTYSDSPAYDASITYGKKYDLPSLTTVNITNTSSFTAYYSLFANADAFSEIYGTNNDYYHTLSSNYAMPVGTKITAIDLAADANSPKYYYYMVNSTTYAASAAELSSTGEATYDLSDFIVMDSTSTGNVYDDSTQNLLYYKDTYNLVSEEFLFIVDFVDTSVASDHIDNSLFLELRNSEHWTVISVLGIRQASMQYNLYESTNVVLEPTLTYSDNYLYRDTTKNIGYDINVNYDLTSGGLSVVDTNYESRKMGLNVYFLDNSDSVVSSSLLVGTSIKIGTTTYYPSSDGVFRIKLADKVTNLSKVLGLTTGNSIPSGDYTVIINLFASSDGLHAGTQIDYTNELDFTVIGENNSLDSTVDNNLKIVDAITGTNLNSTNNFTAAISYQSELTNPNVRVSLYKRNNTSYLSNTYVEVDLKSISSSTFVYPAVYGWQSKTEYEYMISNTPTALFDYTITLKDNLTSGTYKLVYKLYDQNQIIDEDDEYIIIKKVVN